MKDVPKIEELLRPLEERGILIKRTREQVFFCIFYFLIYYLKSDVCPGAANRENCLLCFVTGIFLCRYWEKLAIL